MRKTNPGNPVPPVTNPSRLAAFLSLGLRPFFLGAALFAILSVGLWALFLQGFDPIAPTLGMSLWHRHEMVFGYGSGVLAGFLLTAVANWTGRAPLAGAGLAGLWGLWLAGRVAMMLGAPQVPVALLDTSFLPLVCLIVGREIVVARNWRNLMVLVPVGLVALGNAVFHYEIATGGAPQYGLRFGLGGLVFLVMLIGGRIVPAFSRNWLVKRGAARRPAEFGRLDGMVLLVSLVVLGRWILVPVGGVSGAGLLLIAGLHILRLSRWAGLATWPEPLLFVLHVAYAAIPAGLGLLGLGAVTGEVELLVAAQHVLGIGVIGGMTMAVMTRAGLGHTGQALHADAWLKGGFGLIFLSALTRVLAVFSDGETRLLQVTALFWIAAFAIFVARIGPGLVTPRRKQAD